MLHNIDFFLSIVLGIAIRLNYPKMVMVINCIIFSDAAEGQDCGCSQNRNHDVKDKGKENIWSNSAYAPREPDLDDMVHIESGFFMMGTDDPVRKKCRLLISLLISTLLSFGKSYTNWVLAPKSSTISYKQ